MQIIWYLICSLLAEKKRKKAAEKTAKKAARGKTSLTAANGTGPASAAMREKLRHMRVVQPNLVYVVGLPLDIAKETVRCGDGVFHRVAYKDCVILQTLKKREYFGQYGKVVKIVVNRKIGEAAGRGDSACAYVTYSSPEHARVALMCVDGFNFKRRTIKAMFGTTKYCHQFLGGRPCSNPDCMYLHSVAEGDTSFTKDEMQSGRTFNAIVQPGRGAANPANEHYQGSTFPPRQYAFMGVGAMQAPAAAAASTEASAAPSTPVAVTAPPPANAWKTGGVPPVAAAARSQGPSDALSDRAARFRAQRAALRDEDGENTPALEDAVDASVTSGSGAGDTEAASATGSQDDDDSGEASPAPPLTPKPTTTIGLLSCASGLFLPALQPGQTGSASAGSFGFAVHAVPAGLADRMASDADLLLPAFGDLTAALASLQPGRAGAGSTMLNPEGVGSSAVGGASGAGGGGSAPPTSSKASSAGRTGGSKGRR